MGCVLMVREEHDCESTSKTFAPDRERDEQGLVLFPINDRDWRREVFTEESFKHPAKANLFLVEAIVNYTTEPGQVIMDITAGTGSLMIAAKTRRVVLIELNDTYIEWINKSIEMMGLQVPQQVLLLKGACQNLLPIPVDSIIFSPPYAQALGFGAGIAVEQEMILNYSATDPKNLGLMNNFIYNQEMEKVYAKCLDSLSSSGKLTLIIKDRMNKGKRAHLGLAAIRTMERVGFRTFDWQRWKPSGNIFTKIRRSRGEEVVDDEHIIIMEKP